MSSTLKNTFKIAGRNFIYPKLIKGKLYTYRSWFSYSLLAVLFALPFLKFRGEQLVLLNFLERKFVFFGLLFTPQDFFLFGFAMIIFIVVVTFFTVIFGRLWCGWACPQTIFMEMVFRRIEYWIEGDSTQQLKLDRQAWNLEKIAKKVFKHALWILVSSLIAHTFLAYIIGSDQLIKIITEPVSSHLIGFISIWVFTLVFYFVFSYIREVVCTAICPYGRLQGVLLDGKSVVVAYDVERGEPRAKHLKLNTEKKGDCVDCGLCVQVCPTGIDIRQGTQMECVNCTACIDACDRVMNKIGKPEKLIGFYHNDYIQKGIAFKIGTRAYAYGFVLLVLIIGFGIMMTGRSEVQMTLLRASGTLFQDRGNGEVSNLYTLELVNKSQRDITFEIKSTQAADRIEFIQGEKILEKDGVQNLTFFLIRRKDQISKFKSPIEIEILDNGKSINKVSSTFYTQP